MYSVLNPEFNTKYKLNEYKIHKDLDKLLSEPEDQEMKETLKKMIREDPEERVSAKDLFQSIYQFEITKSTFGGNSTNILIEKGIVATKIVEDGFDNILVFPEIKQTGRHSISLIKRRGRCI